MITIRPPGPAPAAPTADKADADSSTGIDPTTTPAADHRDTTADYDDTEHDDAPAAPATLPGRHSVKVRVVGPSRHLGTILLTAAAIAAISTTGASVARFIAHGPTMPPDGHRSPTAAMTADPECVMFCTPPPTPECVAMCGPAEAPDGAAALVAAVLRVLD